MLNVTSDSKALIEIELGFCVLKSGDLVPPLRHFISEWFFYLSELYFSTVLPVSGVKPVIFRHFGQYDSSPGYAGHTLVSAISYLPFAEARIGR